MARQFSPSVNWREAKREGQQNHSATDSPVAKQNPHSKKCAVGGRSYFVPAISAREIFSRSLYTPWSTAREEEGPGSGSGDNSFPSSSTGEGRSGSWSSVRIFWPASGKGSAKRMGDQAAAFWDSGTLNSRKIMASIWAASKNTVVDIRAIGE